MKVLRDSRAMGLAILSIGLTALLAACFGGVGQKAADIQTHLVGLDVQKLKRCMGDAHYFEIRPDGSELWAYRAKLAETPADIEIVRAFGRGTASQRPRVESGNPIERKAHEKEVAKGSVPPGSCLYLFTLKEGSVDQYASRGRTSTNLNADAACTVAINRCVPAPKPTDKTVARGTDE